MVRDLLTAQDNTTDLLNLIARIALTVTLVSGDTVEGQRRSQEAYVAKHHLLFASFSAGVLTLDKAHNAATLTEGMLRLLQLRHTCFSRERFGEWLVTSLDAGWGKVHIFLK